MKRPNFVPPADRKFFVGLTALVLVLLLHAPAAFAQFRIDWTKQALQGPPARIEDMLVYDSVAQRLVMFGGYDLNSNRLNDIWEYDGLARTWMEVTPAGGAQPAPRQGQTMAFDPVRRVIILFGGVNDSDQYVGDTWEWNTQAKTWTNVTPAISPSPRQGARMIYDAARGRMILFGGVDAGQYFNQTWEWNPIARTWTQLTVVVSSPTNRTFLKRTFAGLAYNSSNGGVTVFGGIGNANNATTGSAVDFNDIWELHGNTWTDVTPAGANPPGRGWTQLAYDIANSRMVLFGGWNQANSVSLGDTWVFSGGSWTQLPLQGFGVRDSHGMAYDAARQKVVVFGGYLADIIELDGTNLWSRPLLTYRPPAQDQHTMAYDTDRNTVFLYGGGQWEVSELTPSTTSWTYYYVPGPNDRRGQASAYEPTRHRTLMFGGRRLAGTPKLNDTWEWNAAARQWTNTSPASSPSARDDHAMAYDAVYGYPLLFGGHDVNGTVLGDTGLWNGSTWINVTKAGGPTPRFGAAMTYDVTRGVVVLFGGDNGVNKLNDVWEWDGVAQNWRQVIPVGAAPPARSYASLAPFAAGNPGVALFGGIGASLLNDTWIWNGKRWTQATVGGAAPSPRQRAEMVYDPASHRMVLYGGRDARGISGEQWVATISGTAPMSSAPGDFDGDAKSDVTVFRPSNGAWYVLQSSTNFTGFFFKIFGQPGDIPVPGDYDGDGKKDIAVYRPSNGAWYVLQSSTNFTGSAFYLWGQPGDVPVPGDYDGDGKTDVVVYRPSNGAWYISKSSTNFTGFVYYIWGQPGDVPVPGDFDGDGKADVVVYRPSNGAWFILQSSTNFTAFVYYTWGQSSDSPVQGDFDGDGKADVVVYRPSNGAWYILKSSTNFTGSVFYIHGQSGDIPAPGDFDGDGKTDVVVYRPSNGAWYILLSSTNFTGSVFYIWGQAGDIPVLKRP